MISKKIPDHRLLLLISQQACDLNSGGGCSNLGFMYKKGKGVKQDNFKALKFFQKACDLNYGGGCFNLGFMYKKGKGVKQDDFKAFKFYQKACALKSSCLTPLPFSYESPRLEQPLPSFKPHAFQVKPECLEIILFNAFAFFIHKSKIRARHSSFT